MFHLSLYALLKKANSAVHYKNISNTFTVYVYVISTFSSVSIESVKSSEYSCMMYFQFPGPGLGFRVYTAKNAQVVPS